MTWSRTIARPAAAQGRPPTRLMATVIPLAELLSRRFAYRGLYRAMTLFSKSSGAITVSDGGRAILTFSAGDPYWLPLVAKEYHYEPEIERLLTRLQGTDALFLDVGANMGYWSVAASNNLGPGSVVVAVEPNPTVGRWLTLNQQHGNYQIVKRAIYSHSGRTEVFETSRLGHAGGHLSVTPKSYLKSSSSFEVTTITIDDLVTQHQPNREQTLPIIVKLDVEGAESAALDGAALTLGRDALWIFEDHGQDDHARAARAFASRDIGLWFLPRAGEPIWLPTIDSLRPLKVHRGWGYNVLACNPDGEWPERLGLPRA